MRAVPSRRENKDIPPVLSKRKSTVPPRRGTNCIPSRHVVKNYVHRPRPVEQRIYTVLSRRDKFYLPSRPFETIFTYRPVPS